MRFLRLGLLGTAVLTLGTLSGCFSLDLGGPIELGTHCETDADCTNYVPSFTFFYSPLCKKSFCGKDKLCDTKPENGASADASDAADDG